MREKIADILIEARLIEDKEDPRLAEPFRMLSGKGKVSEVYFFFIPKTPGSNVGRYVVIKLDDPKRAAKEKAAWTDLERVQIDMRILKPLHISLSGPIIYEAAEGFVNRRKCVDLESFLQERLAHDVDSTKLAIGLAVDVLKSLYSIEPGNESATASGLKLKWADEFSKLTSNHISNQIEETSKTVAWQVPPIEGWKANVISVPELGKGKRKLPNPLLGYQSCLNDEIGKVWISRNHGDINFNNIVLGDVFPGQSPTELFVIDLANSRENAVTICDFARMESEFWQEIYPVTARKHQGYDDALALRIFVAARDILDGNLPYNFFWKRLGKNCTELVSFLRQRAAECVKLNHDSIEFQTIYHTALYFTCLRALAYPSIWNPDKGGGTLKARIAFIGAALSLDVITRPRKFRRFRFVALLSMFLILLGILGFSVFMLIESLAPSTHLSQPTKRDVYVFRESSNELPPVDLLIRGEREIVRTRLEKGQLGTTVELVEGEFTIKVGQYEKKFKVPEKKMLKLPGSALE